MTPHDILHQVFGFDTFRAGQEEVITRLLAGNSTLAIFPTGGGKSLCYQVPALLLDGITVVISPLIALMKDQIDALTRRGVAAARLDSSLDAAATRQLYDDLDAGRLKLLYIAPERLSNERFLARLRRLPIALLAVDEAHCISEWGHNFRPDYLKIADLARGLRIPRVLGLTATATPEVASGILKAFDMPPDSVVHTGFYRPNLHLNVTAAGRRDEVLLARLQSRPAGPTIVYVTLQRTAETVAEHLSGHGIAARAYHAGLDAAVRTQVQDWFMASTDAVVVATIAFGMGIDKADIRYVYHYNLPKTLENYAQEIGRAGRDGKPSTCEVLASLDDVTTLENFVYGDTPTREALTVLVETLLAQPAQFDISVSELAALSDIRPLVVETVLTYLELDGTLQSTGPFYNEYKLQLLKPVDQLLATFDPARRAFLQQMLGQARPAVKWSHLDVTAAARALNEPRTRLVNAIGYLDEKGFAAVQVAGVRQGYRRLSNPSPEDLIGSLVARFEARERADLGRIAQVVRFVSDTGCCTHRLWRYFGEITAERCGHCSACDGAPQAVLDAPAGSPDLSAAVRAIPDSPALQHPRQKARFLCGLTSPMASRARLAGHPAFGRLADVPFKTVLDALTS